jgi:hypothetical protein
MSYIITHNIIDNETKKARTREQEKRYPHYFELYDDDDELYFKGYSSNDSSFGPLDGAGASYGCTYMKYRNHETRKMDIL